ncbi:peptidylprolyl isomerase [candidate division TA06 bacterium]|uniref:Periplasmic chaperone PpiD n=1 Tax=candidate division TA06 bacterium TaxID=2250710 RepID=A0A933I8N2_UNCT6|nr:peptidylprolyl isomerase [candidate division TA06 bacterium]
MVMQMMRRKMKVIMWVVVVTFVVGFVYVIMGTGGSLGKRQDKLSRGIAGEAGGQEISTRQYQEALSRSREQYRARFGADPDEAAFRQMEQEVWQGLLGSVILQRAYRQYGIRIYDEEIVGIIKNRPPNELMQDPQLMTNGQFDMQKYQSVISNPQNLAWLVNYENQLREQLPQQKLNLQVLAGVRVTDQEIIRVFQDQNEKVKASYVAVDPAKYFNAQEEVSSTEIAVYYKSHQDEFQAPERVKISFVALAKEPTERDLAELKLKIDDIYAQAAKPGASFDTLAMEYSEDPGSALNGGDLGFFEKETMDPAFAEAAFRLSPKQISKPFQSSFGWHIVKVEERKTEAGKLKVRARHILLRIKPGEETLSQLRTKAESFAEQAKTEEFEKAAQAAGLQAIPTGFLPRGGFIPGLGAFPEALNFAFDEKAGTISQVLEGDGALVVVRVLEKRKEGVQPLADLEQRIKMTVIKERARDKAKALAQQIKSAIKSGQTMPQAAAAAGARFDTTTLMTRQDMVPGVGTRNEFFGAAFSQALGIVGNPVSTDYGVYLIRVEKHIMPDQALLSRQAPQISQQLLQAKQRQAMQQWYNYFQGGLKVRDYRVAGM